MTSHCVCGSACRYQHLTILAYMFIGGIHWHPFMISDVAWNYCVHSVSPLQPANCNAGFKLSDLLDGSHP